MSEVINLLATSVCSIKITLYFSVCMRTSGEKICISDEAERVHSVSYHRIRSLSELYIIYSTMLLSLMPIEETGETRVRNDCLNFDVSLCIQTKKQISVIERSHWNYVLVGF